jgi:hypothetical protein
MAVAVSLRDSMTDSEVDLLKDLGAGASAVFMAVSTEDWAILEGKNIVARTEGFFLPIVHDQDSL